MKAKRKVCIFYGIYSTCELACMIVLVTLLSAWIDYYIHFKNVMNLFIHSQTLAVQPLKFGNGEVIPSHILLGMWLHIKGIKVKPC